jgi:hypothetical protein
MSQQHQHDKNSPAVGIGGSVGLGGKTYHRRGEGLDQPLMGAEVLWVVRWLGTIFHLFADTLCNSADPQVWSVEEEQEAAVPLDGMSWNRMRKAA